MAGLFQLPHVHKYHVPVLQAGGAARGDEEAGEDGGADESEALLGKNEGEDIKMKDPHLKPLTASDYIKLINIKTGAQPFEHNEFFFC